MTIGSNHPGNAVVLRIASRLDAITAREFEAACKQHINSEIRKVVLDFEGVDYVSSAGLRAVLLAGKMLQAGGGVLGFSGLRGTAKQVLEMSGICALFPLYDSVEVALEPL